MLGENVAVVIQHLVHDVGLVEIATVDAGGLGPDQFDGGHVEGLAEGVGGQGHHLGVEGLFILENALHLTDHVDAGLIHQAEGLQVFIVGLGAHGQAHADKGGVAGMAHRLDEGLLAVAAVVGAVNGLIPALDPGGTGAVEGGAFGHLALLQRRRQGDGLEGGAGLIGGVDALVAPLGLDGVVNGIGPGLGVLLLRFIGGAVGVDLGQGRFQLGLQGVVKEDAGLVEIVVGIGGHGDDGPGVHIHDDAGAAVLGPIFFQHALQTVFQAQLHVGVQGQHQIMAVFRVVILLIGIQQSRTGSVSGADSIAGGAGEGIVIFCFQAHAALVLVIYKAQHTGGQGAVEIIPLGGRLEPDPLELHPLLFRHLIAVGVDLAVDKAADLVGNVLLRLLFDVPVFVVGLGHPGFQGLLLHPQDTAEALGDIGLVPENGGRVGFPLVRRLLGGLLLLFLLTLHELRDPLGGDVHVLRRGGEGQGVQAAVINSAPGGGHHRAAGLLLHGPALKLIVPEDLQIIKPPEEDRKGHHAQKQHDQRRPAADHLVGPAGRVTFSAKILRHGMVSFQG